VGVVGAIGAAIVPPPSLSVIRAAAMVQPVSPRSEGIDLPARQAYLDGELCGVRPDGTTSFSLIQNAQGPSKRFALFRVAPCGINRLKRALDEPAAQYGSSTDSPVEEPGFEPWSLSVEFLFLAETGTPE
jgi:hypothetical protein